MGGGLDNRYLLSAVLAEFGVGHVADTFADLLDALSLRLIHLSTLKRLTRQNGRYQFVIEASLFKDCTGTQAGGKVSHLIIVIPR